MSALATLRLTAKLIPIIAPFIAKNDIRYYLNGINVRPHPDGGAVICATNGHALGAILDPAAVCEAEVTLLLDPRMLQACAGCIQKNRVLKVLNGRLAVVENGGKGEAEVYIQAGEPEITGGLTYPRYETVIPKAEQLKPGLLGAYQSYILALAERAAAAAAKAHGSTKGNAIRFFNVGHESGSGVVRLELAPDFVGVLMPVRVDAPATPAPAWAERLTPVAAPAAAAGGAQ